MPLLRSKKTPTAFPDQIEPHTRTINYLHRKNSTAILTWLSCLIQDHNIGERHTRMKLPCKLGSPFPKEAVWLGHIL